MRYMKTFPVIGHTHVIEVDGPARAGRDVERPAVGQYDIMSSSCSDVIDPQVSAQVVDQPLTIQLTRQRM